jgi:hypothetical protein
MVKYYDVCFPQHGKAMSKSALMTTMIRHPKIARMKKEVKFILWMEIENYEKKPP